MDALIETLITAPDKASLVTATRALDRVLQHGCYVLPGWYGPNLFLAYWKDGIELPKSNPPFGTDMTTWFAAPQNRAARNGKNAAKQAPAKDAPAEERR